MQRAAADCRAIFEIGTEWKRYQFTLEPQRWTGGPDSNRKPVVDTYYLRLITPALKRWKTIWLDGIQVEMGPVTPYTAPEPVSFGFSIDRGIAVYHPDEIPQIVLHAAGKGIAGQSVKVQMDELISGTKEPARELLLAADGDADHGQVAIPLSPQPRGCYRITASTLDGKVVQSRGYGVIASLANRPHDHRAFLVAASKLFRVPGVFPRMAFPWDRPIHSLRRISAPMRCLDWHAILGGVGGMRIGRIHPRCWIRW